MSVKSFPEYGKAHMAMRKSLYGSAERQQGNSRQGKTAEYQTDNENAIFNVFAAVVPVGSLQADYGAVVEEFFNISNIPKARYESCPR